MNLKLTNINGVLYIIDANNPNGFKYNVINMIQINEGAFLVGQNETELNNFDVTKIEKFSDGLNFKVRESTQAEKLLMSYIQSTLQKKMEQGELKTTNDLRLAVDDINKYINSNPILQKNIRELEGKDNIVIAKEKQLINYFEDSMSKNQYFQKPIFESVEVEPINNENVEIVGETSNVIAQPIVETIEVPENVMHNNSVRIPQYDEQTVTAILSAPHSPNFDLNIFIQSYMNDFNAEQIDLLLNNFNLNEVQRNQLNARKDRFEIQTSSMSQSNTNSKETEKVKRFNLFGGKENKEAAFVDTLLLSFTVGILSGVYLMYFVLTIMS